MDTAKYFPAIVTARRDVAPDLWTIRIRLQDQFFLIFLDDVETLEVVYKCVCKSGLRA